ncbi:MULTISPECIES: condensation domain-containing protein [Frankia]|uniref:condensation domain-containing protein n=1 Tax=Frankia TaxID=1854 RepID=UPI0002DEFB11|nr:MULTISPECIES: condensation domain-containing protein [Frankia]
MKNQGGSPAPAPDRVLTSSEQILAASNRASAPLTCGLFVQTMGTLDVTRLRLAVRRAIGRHPMMRASLYGARQYAWRFATMPSSDPVGQIGDGSDGWRVHETMMSSPFDLRAYPPLRIALVHRPDGDQLSVVAHHLAVDGMSLAAVVSEIFAEYRVADADADASAAAGRSGGGHVGLPAGVPSVPRSAGHGWTAFTHRSGRHITPMDAGRTAGYGYHPLTLPVPGRRVLLPGGRRMTANDLLVAAAHLTIDRWNRQRGGEAATLRVRMPIGLGTMPGAGGNNTGQVLVGTEPADRADLIRLAVRIVDQTEHAKQAAAAPVIAGVAGRVGAAATGRIPGPWRGSLLRLGVRTARPLITPAAAVSNLGPLADITSDTRRSPRSSSPAPPACPRASSSARRGTAPVSASRSGTTGICSAAPPPRPSPRSSGQRSTSWPLSGVKRRQQDDRQPTPRRTRSREMRATGESGLPARGFEVRRAAHLPELFGDRGNKEWTLRHSESGAGLVEPDEQLRLEMASGRSALAQLLREEVRTARGTARVRAGFELALFRLLGRPRFMQRTVQW